MKMPRKRILFIAPWSGSSFIEQDVHILKRHFVVSKVTLTAQQLLRQLAFLFVAILSRKVDGVFIWFVYYWASPIVLVSKLAGVRTVLVPSGIDIASNPEIDYGHMRFLKDRIMVRFALNHCDMVLPVSFFVEKEVLRYARPKKMKVVHNGIDLEKFRPSQSQSRENLVITVGTVSEMNLKYKRFDLFVESAKYLPEVKFVLIGAHHNGSVKYLQSKAPPNVAFPGFVSFPQLVEYYGRAKAYLQLSHAEAFGCALAEAMACECVPLVVERGSLPEVVGNTGFYAPYDDPKGIAETLKEALDSDKGRMARERISNFFSLERRENELLHALTEVLN